MPKSPKAGKSPVRRATARRDNSPADTPVLTHAAIAARAYELFLERGGQHGQDFEDWLIAERELHRSADL